MNILLASLNIIIVVGALGAVFIFAKRQGTPKKYESIGEVVASFPISYKSSGYIIKVCDKYYLCCESCGLIEIEFNDSLLDAIQNNSFKNILAKEFSKIASKKKK